MNKTLYEINWHSVGDRFSHCSVTPITVIREGVLPGCSGVSITAIGSDGRKFLGAPSNYYATEAEAWTAARKELEDSIEAKQADLFALASELRHLRTYLQTLPTDTQ